MPRSSGNSLNCKSKLLNTINPSFNFNNDSSTFFNNSLLKHNFSSSTIVCNNIVSCKNILLNVLYTNIRSILNKISFVESYLCTENIDLFSLTETWLSTKLLIQLFVL